MEAMIDYEYYGEIGFVKCCVNADACTDICYREES